MKTTLDLPEDLVLELKLRAVMQRRSIKDTAVELLRRAMASEPEERVPEHVIGKQVGIGEDGIPFIRCGPDAPASRMSITELLALEQDVVALQDMQRAGIPL